jgi:hypothetical protein
MTDTIKLKKPIDMPSEFEDWKELLDFLLQKEADDLEEGPIGFFPLPEEEITDEMRKKMELIDKMDIEEFEDLR